VSSEREKLIEIWLDNAGERQYQFAFRNALLSAGHTILHNTSHTALELGKDVLAVAPDGTLFAYQLKGNPGGRLTISQWQELLPQINTLVYQPISHPSVKAGTRHMPVLVTNGEIHEDVYAAITSYNAGLVPNQPAIKPLQTIARGQLLKQILSSADTLWPVEVKLQRDILNVFTAPGDDELPMEQFVSILANILKGKYTDIAIPSVHLVTAILASNWIERKNYFELIKMYSLIAVASICYQARWTRQRAKDKRFIEKIVFDLRAHIKGFIADIIENYSDRPLINDHIFNEFAYYHPRKKMISGVLSAAVLDHDLVVDDDTREFLWDFICKRKHSQFLLWEGIIPYCLAEFWAFSNIQGTNEPHRRLASLIRDILRSNGKDEDVGADNLPGPYYSLVEVVQWRYKLFLANFRSPIDRDSSYRRSWFAEPLFFLLARRNYKSACQLLWPDLTRFIHPRTRIPTAIDFGPSKCETAIAEDMIIDTTQQKTWAEVTEEASINREPQIPPHLLMRPTLVLLYCLFVPQRMDRDVILWLDRAFCKTWY
jgi:hypothetical protein